MDGAKVTPTAAQMDVYDPEGTLLLDDEELTISGTLCSASAVTTTTASWPIATGYRAEVIFTYNSLTYDRTYYFDVVRWLLDLSIGFDQLVAVDDSIRGMRWDGDADFNALIESCRDYMQTRIEAKVIDDQKMVENMILDHSAVSTAARFYMLGQIMLAKHDMERYEIYKSEFEELFRAVMSTIRYSVDQDTEEPSDFGGLVTGRLVT